MRTNTMLMAGEANRNRHDMERMGFRTIPHKPLSRDALHDDWRKRDYSDFKWTQLFEEGGTYSIELQPDDLVLSVRFGCETALHSLEWEANLGDLMAEYPHVLTPSGAWQIFMKKDPAIVVPAKLDAPGYNGLTFRSAGTLLLGPGALHPDSYGCGVRAGNWSRPIPKAPPELLKLVGRAAKTSRFRGYTYEESLAITAPKYLIAGWLPAEGLAQLYGKPKVGKTFISLDMALCVATGRPYHGHEVQRGKVLYIAAEGGAMRFSARIKAWCKFNKVDPAELAEWFVFVDVPVNFTDPKTVEALLRESLGGPERALTIIDTVAKNSGGMDEDTAGMKAFVNGVNTFRVASKGAVLVLHHEGKDARLGPRGSSVLSGDVDVTLHAGRKGNKVKVSVHEARDMEGGASMVFEMARVILGELEDEGVALRLVDAHATREPSNASERILVAVAEAGVIDPKDLVDEDTKGMSKANVYKVLDKLLDKKLVAKVETATGGERYELTDAGQDEARSLGADLPEDNIDYDED